jgi:Uma2 family endonuclease
MLLTLSIIPVLKQLHPDGNYAIGQDSGIYWRLIDPPEKGAESPDWFYVPNVPPTLDGSYRRSYVLWKESVAPLIAIEFVSGDGSEERDTTPRSPEAQVKPGKFWVYEQAIRIPYYAIYEVKKSSVEVYELQGSHYQRLQPNAAGRYPIPPMGVELGIWSGAYMDQMLPWLRWWDSAGNLLLTGSERAELADQRAELESQQAAPLFNVQKWSHSGLNGQLKKLNRQLKQRKRKDNVPSKVLNKLPA